MQHIDRVLMSKLRFYMEESKLPVTLYLIIIMAKEVAEEKEIEHLLPSNDENLRQQLISWRKRNNINLNIPSVIRPLPTSVLSYRVKGK